MNSYDLPRGPVAGTRLAFAAAAVFFANFWVLSPATASAPPVPTEVEQALLAEKADWSGVWEALGSEESEPESAVLRLIKGHACLALNRNNQSLELFASALNDPDREAWQAWADRFAEDHGDNAVAWYFKGDAHARRKEWKAAADCLDKAIGLDEECYLALNARGVVAHAVGNTLMARVYFLKATKAKEDFADAYASRGTLAVSTNAVRVVASQRGRSAPKSPGDVPNSFARALEYSPGYALAINGTGCLRYGQRLYGEAKSVFQSLEENRIVSILSQHNAAATELALLDDDIDKAADVGTDLRVVRAERNRLESLLRENAYFARPGSKGGRFPNPPKLPPKGPAPGKKKKPGPVKPEPPKPVLPKPPIHKPIPEYYPPDYDPPTIPIPVFRSELTRLRTLVQAGKFHDLPIADVGGADTSGIAKARVNRGGWLVMNWYGLAYDVGSNDDDGQSRKLRGTPENPK